MEKTELLIKLYDNLETKILEPEQDDEVYQQIVDLLSKSEDEAEKRILEWEALVFGFMIQEGKVMPMYSMTQKDGTEWGYPNYSIFTDEIYTYLKGRLVELQNPYLRARYNHILWQSPEKNQNYAREAIDAYIEIIESEKKREFGVENYEWRIVSFIENVFPLLFQVNYKVAVILEMMDYFLFGDSDFKISWKVNLLELLMTTKGVPKEHLIRYETLCVEIYEVQMGEGNEYFHIERTCKIGTKLAQRSGKEVRIWKNRLGRMFEAWAISRLTDQSAMISLEMYRRALIAYQGAGNELKVEAMRLKYAEMRDRLQLDKICIPCPEETQQVLLDFNEKFTRFVLDSGDVWGVLLTSDKIFPGISRLKEEINKRGTDFTEFAVTLEFDGNRNLSQPYENEEVKLKRKLVREFGFAVNFMTLPLLNQIFRMGISENIITYESLVTFLKEQTWLGQIVTETDPEGKSVEYNWVSVLAPALYEFFFQARAILKSGSCFNNYILIIDSLTLKFEGALRDFTSLCGSMTVTSKKEGIREMYIEELMQEPSFRHFFDEDDQILFEYVFTNKGLNLRNQIAHCFFKFHDYSVAYIYLLIMCFLRLGKYRVKNGDDD